MKQNKIKTKQQTNKIPAIERLKQNHCVPFRYTAEIILTAWHLSAQNEKTK